jgi:hypothetical protein
MKRMVNAFAMRQAIGVLEGAEADSSVLARWTILEQRWPALADLLAEKPERIGSLSSKLRAKALGNLEPALKPFANLRDLIDTIGMGSKDALTSARVGEVTRGLAMRAGGLSAAPEAPAVKRQQAKPPKKAGVAPATKGKAAKPSARKQKRQSPSPVK